MKKTILYYFVAILSFAIISCGGNTESSNESTDKNNEENTVEEEIVVSPEEATRITPADVDIDTPIPVADLNKAFFEWQDVEVTITGNVRMYLDDDDFKENFQIVSEAGSTDYLFNCTLAETPEGKIKAEDMIVVKGTITGSGYSGIELENCEYIGINQDYDDSKDLSPYRLPNKPVLAQNLFDVYHAWEGVEVSVIGRYYSTTTSTLSDNVIWRIDLSDPESGAKMVGCRMQTEPDSDYLKDNREDVVIKGIITGESFNAVMIEECVMVE